MPASLGLLAAGLELRLPRRVAFGPTVVRALLAVPRAEVRGGERRGGGANEQRQRAKMKMKFPTPDYRGLATAPGFIVVANTEGAGNGQEIVAGNERVLRARLADARFFWDNDRKQPLARRSPRAGRSPAICRARNAGTSRKAAPVRPVAVSCM